jgi:hypothetical protein
MGVGDMIRFQRLTFAAVVLASLSPAAAPAQSPDTIGANEATAIETLRAIATVQERFKAGAHIDTNCDGVGEYGYFAELAGTRAMRVGSGGDPCVPFAGSPPDDLLFRPFLRSSFGSVRYSCIRYSGYVFQMWLPSTRAAGHITAVQEDNTGGKMAAPFPDPVNGAQMWCCYAWPVDYGHTGRRAFFINQRSDVLEYSNRRLAPFSGFPALPPYDNRPWFDEAYSVVGDMGSPPRIGIPNANRTVWWPVP